MFTHICNKDIHKSQISKSFIFTQLMVERVVTREYSFTVCVLLLAVITFSVYFPNILVRVHSLNYFRNKTSQLCEFILLHKLYPGS